jgi:hypothetical protein
MRTYLARHALGRGGLAGAQGGHVAQQVHERARPVRRIERRADGVVGERGGQEETRVPPRSVARGALQVSQGRRHQLVE